MIFIADVVKGGNLLEKLFTWQYFEPALFGSIGVLLVLLFIVLFLGKKDQKKKLEETKKLELDALKEDNSVDAFAKEETPEVALEAKEEEPEIAPVVIEDAPVMNMDTAIEEESKPEEKEEEEQPEDNEMPDFEIFGSNSEPVAEEQIPEPEVTDIPIVAKPVIKEEVPVVDDIVKSIVAEDEDAIKNDIVVDEEKAQDDKIMSFKENFADLASSISKELDEINRMQEESANNIELPAENKEVELPKEIDVNTIEDTPKFAPTEVFSSVYSPNSIKEDETPALKNDIELPKEAEINNPFASEMPAIKEEAKEELPKEASVVNAPDFSSFGNETFDIK